MDRKNIEINPLLEVYSKYIEKIDSALDKELELYSESEFCEPLKYALDGGKRIRPILTILAAESVGQIDENVYAGACAIELLHTESVQLLQEFLLELFTIFKLLTRELFLNVLNLFKYI